MRGINILWYSIKQGFKNIKNNGLFTLATIGTIAACMFLFGIFYFVIFNFNYMINNAEKSVGVTVFFDEGISEEGINSIGDAIKTRDEVSGIVFISAEEAWETFKKENAGDNMDLYDTFGDDNPLKDSASYEVHINDIDRQKELVDFIDSLEGVREVKSSDILAKSLGNVNRLVSIVSAAIIIILIAVSLFLINTIVTMGINVRKDEIAIMKLVGAKNGFIRRPFLIEGMVIGFLGAALPMLILPFLYNQIIVYVTDKFSIISNLLVFAPATRLFGFLIPISILVGVGIGLFGSIFTIRKYLKV